MTLTILGNNSALPAHGRHPTSQVLQTDRGSFLIDCGEGTQMQIGLYKIKPGKIHTIFISHLHGDHYFGLVGLLNSMALLSRQDPITVIGPAFLQEIINIQLQPAQTVLPFPLHFIALESLSGDLIIDGLNLKFFPVAHRIPCWGVTFTELKKSRSVLPEAAKSAGIPLQFYRNLQEGEDYHKPDGTVIYNLEVTETAPKSKSYGYCADTKFDTSFIPYIKGVDLLYHESTFLKDAAERAEQRFHSTSVQAATIAKEANVKKLLLGHFSSKYKVLDQFCDEARTIFSNTEIAEEGSVHII